MLSFFTYNWLMLLEHTHVMQFYGTNVFVKYIHLFMSG
jgi:hypothetical protein